MTRLSSRSRFVAQLNSLTIAHDAARAAGRPVLDLTESNPTHAGLSPGASALLPLLQHEGVARYEPHSLGLPSARASVQHELARSGFDVALQDVLLTASTSEAYGYLFKLLCDPGDCIMVPTPSYPLFDVLAQLENVRLVPYQLQYDGEWHVDLAAVRATLQAEPRVRAIVLVHPNNPTGSYLKRDELAALAALELPLISDEVFADYDLGADDRRAVSALEVADRTLVFRLGGLSKACALPQLKLAWTAMAGPAQLVAEARARLEHIADSYLSPGVQVQLALPALLAASTATRAAIVERVRANIGTLRQALHGSSASVLRIEGGWYAIARLPAVLTDEQWALHWLELDGVLVQPGYYYELAGAHAVLSMITPPSVLCEALRRIVARIDAVVR